MALFTPAPTVASVAPGEGSQLYLWIDITVRGTGFMPGAAVRIEKGTVTGEAAGVNVSRIPG